jgi:hypothetical protein
MDLTRIPLSYATTPAGESKTPDRWEHGSDFHWLDLEPPAEPEPVPWHGGTAWTSGRDALAALCRARRWRRLWVPTYFCQKVLAALRAAGVELAAYPDSPLDPAADPSRLPAKPGDGILVVNYFGLRSQPADAYPGAAEVVEDHSHDPFSDWARRSRAPWCVASLRKTLPAPAGGVVWSPEGLVAPTATAATARGERAALAGLTALLLKRLYLDGQPVAKKSYRQLAAQSESALGDVSALPGWAGQLIATFPTGSWRRARRQNFASARSELSGVHGLRLLEPAAPDSVPFSLVLVLDRPTAATALRAALIRRRVYAARLWDLEQPVLEDVPEAHRELSRCAISVHCDQRYGASHMRDVARTIRALTAVPERA